MKSLHRMMAILTCSLAVAGCLGSGGETTTTVQVFGARSAADWTLKITQGIRMSLIRPSALLGVYVSDYLVHTSIFQSALAGINAQMELVLDEDEAEDEAFALLEELGTMLQVDIVDLLNRSTNRPGAFEAYVSALSDTAQRSTLQLEALEQELEIINDERRERRKEVSDIQHELNLALREQDYGTASTYQRQIIDAEAELARVESMEDEQRSIIQLYEELLEIAEERMVAMTSNREAIIAGIRIIEMPGVDDLGLIEQGRRSRRSRDSIFDPGFGDSGL